MRTRTWVLLGTLGAVAVAGGLTYAYLDAQPPGEGGVTGRYIAVDDTGFRDRPIDDGTFLVIPGATVLGIWPGVAEPSDGPNYRNIRPRVDVDELAAQYGAVRVEVQSDGRFRITTPPGPTIVCLLFLDTVDGCVEIDLPERGSLRATFGIAGFSIRVR